ncbi:glycine betaine/L-proline ABC transporter substrate-binding protein ProX [Vibrio quintilis]|uniref:Glycine betaine-binding periplasmic protein n=1 Tax=Vibrio quintilis TaxID=1117707 RepID=A0A1M7YWG0_9VIBR|nr:glycine betaine/L-proline ABC transporter substrate-binding protein ProX [Vibrio quintilis]SHO56964.1 Glycine betaine-binding periplasmic protein precursor [Vibrio quintilis]
MQIHWNKVFPAGAIFLSVASAPVLADKLPGEGITVQPVQSTIAEETFQTLIVNKAMEALGYQVLPTKEVDYNVAYTSIARNDATYLTVGWWPQQESKFWNAGGYDKLYMKGQYVTGAAQGYLIDKKTADKYHITNVAQLSNPELAKLFDTDGDGKADLTGCNPGWSCEDVITNHIKAYKLSKTVTQNQGNYAALIADTISRYRTGKPVLYYTWTPYWVSGVLVPGKDVVWLQVPFSSLPEKHKQLDTSLPNGKNYGFPMNSMNIIANKTFAEKNPAAAKLFSIMKLSVNDISAENMMLRRGKNTPADIEAHANGWIKANQKRFNHWIEQAKAAAK